MVTIQEEIVLLCLCKKKKVRLVTRNSPNFEWPKLVAFYIQYLSVFYSWGVFYYLNP